MEMTTLSPTHGFAIPARNRMSTDLLNELGSSGSEFPAELFNPKSRGSRAALVTDADRPILFMEEAPADDFCASTEGGRSLSAWWYIYLSREHSDSIRIRYISPLLKTEAASDFRTSVDDLEEVSLTFSLTTTELAKILGVSRRLSTIGGAGRNTSP